MINLTFCLDHLKIGNLTKKEQAGLECFFILNDIEFINVEDEFVVLNPGYLTVRELLSFYECTMHFEERSWQND